MAKDNDAKLKKKAERQEATTLRKLKAEQKWLKAQKKKGETK